MSVNWIKFWHTFAQVPYNYLKKKYLKCKWNSYQLAKRQILFKYLVNTRLLLPPIYPVYLSCLPSLGTMGLMPVGVQLSVLWADTQ